jgi:hypothetical protein
MRVIQTGNRLRFPFEPLFADCIVRNLLGKNLDGDGALKPLAFVLRFFALGAPPQGFVT